MQCCLWGEVKNDIFLGKNSWRDKALETLGNILYFFSQEGNTTDLFCIFLFLLDSLFDA